MDEADRIRECFCEGRACPMFVPFDRDFRAAADEVREHGMNLSIVPMVTDDDQKLAIGPGTLVAVST